MKYCFIDRYSSVHRVERMCRVIGASRSGYYQWKKRDTCNRKRENKEMVILIQESHKKSRKTYGSPRITRDLQSSGIKCGENRIARLMKANGISAQSKRKFKATTNSRHNLPVARNILDRNFVSDNPDTAWVSDITYIPTGEGWLYLSVIIDIYSRRVVGWSMSDRITSGFVAESLNQAIGRRNPEPGCIFHSDRGIQYASLAVRKILKSHGFITSMCRKGDCYDNAVAESFFHTLKTEHIHNYRYETIKEAKQSIFEYIEVFYNQQRIHSSLGYRSPVSFELENMVA